MSAAGGSVKAKPNPRFASVVLDWVDSEEGLERVRKEVEASLKEPLIALGIAAPNAIDVGGSVGEALFPEDGTDAESLLKKADRRMYGQKFSDREESIGHPRRRASDRRAS